MIIYHKLSVGSGGGAGLWIGDTYPPNPKKYPLWFNPKTRSFSVFNGSTYETITGSVNLKILDVWVGNTPPSDTGTYKFWYNTSEKELYVFNPNTKKWEPAAKPVEFITNNNNYYTTNIYTINIPETTINHNLIPYEKKLEVNNEKLTYIVNDAFYELITDSNGNTLNAKPVKHMLIIENLDDNNEGEVVIADSNYNAFADLIIPKKERIYYEISPFINFSLMAKGKLDIYYEAFLV